MPDLRKLATFPSKPCVFILTDTLNESDDSQSLVRYLLYSSEFETRGISTRLDPNTHPEEIRRIINAYGKVVKNLNSHVNPDFQYQIADELLKLVTYGPAVSQRGVGTSRPSGKAFRKDSLIIIINRQVYGKKEFLWTEPLSKRCTPPSVRPARVFRATLCSSMGRRKYTSPGTTISRSDFL